MVLLTLLASVALAQQDDFAAQRQRYDIERNLRVGNWNERIHAVHRLEPLGAGGLPLLEFAAEDADWQVRMTAVHYLGRVGLPALDVLSRVLKDEPCRHVRLTALHWLGRMGPEAEPALREAMEDESRLVRINNRYWLKKLDGGGPDSDNDPDTKAERSAAGDEDARRCVASPEAGRLRKAAPETAPAPEQAEEPPQERLPDLVVPKDKPKLDASAPLTAAERGAPTRDEREQELDDILGIEPRKPGPAATVALASPEELGDVASPARHAASGGADASALSPSKRKSPDPELLGKADGETERFPAGPPGARGREADHAEASLEADAGTGKPEGDPVPALLRLLASSEAPKRARAADELGKLGARAARAEAPLVRALSDRSPRVRASAALALGNLGKAKPASVRALERALRDSDEDVRWSAATAVALLPGPEAKKAFHRYLGKESRALLPP